MGSRQTSKPDLVRESDLTRLVRTALRLLKQHVLENTSIAVSVDYDNTTEDGLDIVVMSELPSLVLSGPRLTENRFYALNEQRVDAGDPADEIKERLGPTYTVDLLFTLTGASNRTVELLNMVSAIAAFFHANRWISMPRDPDDPSSDTVRWEMDLQEDFRTRLDGPDDVRAFQGGFVVRGFDLAYGDLLELCPLVEIVDLEFQPYPQGEVL